MDKARGLLLWRRLRISNYINVTLTLIFCALVVQDEPPDTDVVTISLLLLIPSHLNYHYQLSMVVNFLGKSSFWPLLSFTTFPVGPLISYLAIKPSAIKMGLTD